MTTTAEVLGELATKNARLQAQLDEAVALLTALTSHYTTKPHCGHDFTCICKDADIAETRAFLARLGGAK